MSSTTWGPNRPARRPSQAIKRVSVDFPKRMVESFDKETQVVGGYVPPFLLKPFDHVPETLYVAFEQTDRTIFINQRV